MVVLIQENNEEQHASCVFEKRCRWYINFVAIFFEKIWYECTDNYKSQSPSPTRPLTNNKIHEIHVSIIRSQKCATLWWVCGDIWHIPPSIDDRINTEVRKVNQKHLSHMWRLNLARINESQCCTGKQQLLCPHIYNTLLLMLHSWHSTSHPAGNKTKLNTNIFSGQSDARMKYVSYPCDFYRLYYTRVQFWSHGRDLQSHILIYK